MSQVRLALLQNDAWKKYFFHNGNFRIIDVLYGDDDATDCPDSIWGSEEDIHSLGAFVVGLCPTRPYVPVSSRTEEIPNLQ